MNYFSVLLTFQSQTQQLLKCIKVILSTTEKWKIMTWVYKMTASTRMQLQMLVESPRFVTFLTSKYCTLRKWARDSIPWTPKPTPLYYTARKTTTNNYHHHHLQSHNTCLPQQSSECRIYSCAHLCSSDASGQDPATAGCTRWFAEVLCMYLSPPSLSCLAEGLSMLIPQPTICLAHQLQQHCSVICGPFSLLIRTETQLCYHHVHMSACLSQPVSRF